MGLRKIIIQHNISLYQECNINVAHSRIMLYNIMLLATCILVYINFTELL